MNSSFISRVREAAKKGIIFTEHALDRMNQEKEMISTEEVREVVSTGEIIEDYPEDSRGHSCLMFARTKQERALHVVCSPKEDYLAIITVYVPDLDKWKPDFKTRRD